MRSRKNEYVITKDEVHGYANEWLAGALKLEYHGRKCSGHVILQVLLIAASRVVSIFAACRDLADAPTHTTMFNALHATLPEVQELERRLNQALVSKVPRALKSKSRVVAMDLTLLPYYGKARYHDKEIYRSKSKAGTSSFHAYATAVVIHKGFRYTLALTRVEAGEVMKDVVQRLLRSVRNRGVKVRYLLLDKGFFSVSVMSYLKRARAGFVIPVIIRGRQSSETPPTGLRALKKKKNGFYRQKLQGKSAHDKKKQITTEVTICVSSKDYVEKKTNKKRRKKLLFALWKIRRTPKEIRELYRKRFGIETSYRQMNEARIKTCTRDPRERLLFVGIALVLRNVWVWLHFRFARRKDSAEPQLFHALLRFKEMLLWITQIVQRILGADKTKGIDLETFIRLTKVEST